MASPAQQHPENLGQTLAQIVSDHEKRLRRIERALFYAAGMASGGGGTWWLTIVMTHR